MIIHPRSLWRDRKTGRTVTVIAAGRETVQCQDGPLDVMMSRSVFLADHCLVGVTSTVRTLVRAVLLSPDDDVTLLALADALEEEDDIDAAPFRDLFSESPGKARGLVAEWAAVIEW